jgi:dTDP-4-amino-4,6-dideoxygalactose transaminase/predicted O-linked N-acetylglucosamine transferase (SPINDLY family)
MLDTTAVPLNDEIQRVADQAMQLALQHIDAGQFDQAATLCRAILDMHPGHAQAEYQLGLLEWQAGRLPEAASHLSGAIQADPAEAAYWLAYIEVLLDGVELAAARETIDLGRRHGLRGNALDTLAQRLARAEHGAPSGKEVETLRSLMKQRRLDEAEHMARAMTVDCPLDAFGWKSLGVIHHMRGQIEPAVKAMAKAAECDHENAETYSNLGLLLKEARRHDDAIVCLQRALELDPKRADAHNNLAVTLLDMNRLAEAEASARASVAIDPKNALAWNTIGVALMGQSRMAGAVDAYRRVLKLEPNNAGVHSNMLFAMSQMEDIDAKELFAEHLRYAERVEAPLRKKLRAHANDRDPQRQLRIGFVSGDLRHHAVASFIEPIFERLAGRPGVALYAYHNHVILDAVSERFKSYMAQWLDVVGLDDDALAQRIRDDGIDILVDLSGHTAHNRLSVFARKPAPLQATWIGYPGTTGLQAMDYYLTDRFILPPGQFDHQFTEKLVYLPVSAPFQPELDSPPINALPALTNGYITFGSFNRISKIGRNVVATWGKLLRALPTSKLLLGGVPPGDITEQMLGWLQEEGVDASRVRVHPRCQLKDYLALHHEVDINLDAFPYSGGTTTLHALWMGVQTLTVAGDTAAGRQTACILEHMQLPEYIACDADDFVRKGLAVCADLETVANQRIGMRLRFGMPSSDFMTQVADGVERALRMMWLRWADGLPAAPIEVPAAEPIEVPAAAPEPAAAQPTIYVTQPAMPPLQDFVASLEQIWDSKFLTNGGQFHQRLEQALCEHLGVEHICLFANGTLALMTALQALGIEGEVITTPYSFVATSHALLWNGLKPVFADIDPLTFNLDPDKIEAAITPSTRAIMPVHCYGTPCDVERIEAIARKHDLKVIYDAAHAFGVRQNGQSILRHGDLSVLSFHATKVFNTFEGGAIVCRDAAMKQHIDHLKNFGIADEVTVVAAGINGKMHEVSAAFGLLQLEGVTAAIEKRAQVAARYRSALDGVPGIACMAELGHESNFGYFPILVDDDYPLGRDGLYQKLRDAGIHARRYFYPLISEFPMYQQIPSATPANLQIAATAARQVLCLPIYPALESQDIERIVSLIKSF